MIQYSIRVCLLFHGRVATFRRISAGLVKGLRSTASGLSMTRLVFVVNGTSADGGLQENVTAV